MVLTRDGITRSDQIQQLLGGSLGERSRVDMVVDFNQFYVSAMLTDAIKKGLPSL